jgi:Tfp pilus assembly protein PilF
LFRGRHRIDLGDCARAASDFTAAIRLEETRAGSWAALATAELCRGDKAASRRAFERALALAPERAEIRRALDALDPQQ